MSAFATAMFDQLKQPESNVSFTERVDQLAVQCPCRHFIEVRPEEQQLMRTCLEGRLKPPRVLDIGCGLGRHLVSSRQLSPNCQGTAVEINPQMLDHTVSAVRGTHPFRQFGDVPDKQRFDVVFLMGGGLGVFGDEANTREQLRRIFQQLSADGDVLIESGNPFNNKLFYAANLTIEYTTIADEAVTMADEAVWGFAKREWVERTLRDIGFTVVSFTQSSVGGPFFICHAKRQSKPTMKPAASKSATNGKPDKWNPKPGPSAPPKTFFFSATTSATKVNPPKKRRVTVASKPIKPAKVRK